VQFLRLDVSVKHFTKADGINKSCSNKYDILCECVPILVLASLHAKHVFYAPYYIVICGLFGCTTVF
jgi:hypothetical protein